ncbi:MAG: chromosome segregation protein SMC [Acidimicrobiia bacterium]
MFLRALTLKGFKSFADSTTLELEPGLTVVVGPNGSGKSNVVDAVAWVLGAQGPRTVRSQRMEDVIFAGNGRRPALGRAEVALTIDNAAGILPIGFSEVTITRTLFRSSGESEYAINGVPCRLLDVQELLSDTGVGRQQHVIVSQGNLDQVLDVRPEDRRLIIEEAAGILKFRRRKEKAERRLESTEAHLVRLTDLLKELRRQMRPLERQAEAARRHEELAAELRALRLYLAGRELAGLRARAEAAERERAGLAAQEAATVAEVRRLDGEVGAAETRLAAIDGRGLDGAVARLDALRERGRGLAALITERARSLAAEVAAMEGGDDPLVRLEADAATLAAELMGADEEAVRLDSAAATLAEAEAELVGRRARLATREAAEAAVRRASEARGERAAVLAAVDRGRAELAVLESQAAELAGAAATAADELAGAAAAASEAGERERTAAEAAAGAESERHAAQKDLAAASAGAQTTERAADAAAARVEALTLAAGTGDVPPPDVAGVLGPLLELVRIDPGWEAAVEAALGGSLHALVVDDLDAARAVLAAGAAAVPAACGPAPVPAAAGAGGGPLRSRVSGPGAIAPLLDRLLGQVAVEDGWEAALDRAWAEPDRVVVTRAGDRFAPGGWRTAGDRPSVAAALAEARRRAQVAQEEAGAARRAAGQAQARLDAAAAAADEARAAADELRRLAAAQRAELARAEADARQAQAALDAARNHAAAAARRMADDERRAASLDAQLSLPLDDPGPVPTGAELEAEREDVAWEAQALAGRRAQIAAQSEAVAARRRDLEQRRVEAEARLAQARTQRSAAAARVARARTDLGHLRRLGDAAATAVGGIDARRSELEQRRQERAAATRELSATLGDLRRRRTEGERRLEEVRARARRVELDEAENRLRLEAAVETLRRDLDCEPEAALAAGCPEVPPGTSPSTRAREVERELRLLGPVNPLAVEELAALEERHGFLTAQLDDVKNTRRDLARVIRSVDEEMTTLLTAAYADVADNFADLFQTLFPGGEGRLRLGDGPILEAGVEIEARPGGKSARKLSLLSGGERSLCALAFLFAVFRSRPSPFYLLDEVEAALDDVNLHRFLRLLDEFRSEAQLLVVSHQKRTMEAADCLFGITMQPGGSSKVLSERVSVSG